MKIRKEMGFYSIRDLSEELNIGYDKIKYAIRSGAIHNPTHKMKDGKCKYYCSAEVAELKRILNKK